MNYAIVRRQPIPTIAATIAKRRQNRILLRSNATAAIRAAPEIKAAKARA